MKLAVGGCLWIPNLTQPDGTLVLPMLLGLSNLAIIEVGLTFIINYLFTERVIVTKVFFELKSLVLIFPGKRIILIRDSNKVFLATLPALMCNYHVRPFLYIHIYRKTNWRGDVDYLSLMKAAQRACRVTGEDNTLHCGP